jgi:hypothetical protein
MFGLLKFLFYSCVAVVVGVVIGTVPFGGRTVAERITALYQSGPSQGIDAPKKSLAVSPKALARTTPRAKQVTAKPSSAPAPGPGAPAAAALEAPVTAGAANTPDGHTDSDKAALDKLIAAKVKGPK